MKPGVNDAAVAVMLDLGGGGSDAGQNVGGEDDNGPNG